MRLVNLQLSQHIIDKTPTLNLATLTKHYKFTVRFLTLYLAFLFIVKKTLKYTVNIRYKPYYFFMHVIRQHVKFMHERLVSF